MANKRQRPEEIVMRLRKVEVLTGQGMPRLDAIRPQPLGSSNMTVLRPERR